MIVANLLFTNVTMIMAMFVSLERLLGVLQVPYYLFRLNMSKTGVIQL